MKPKRSFAAASSSIKTRPAAGFTLIELLVVLSILGIMLGAMISQGTLAKRDEHLKQLADALDINLKIAQEEAILQGLELGLLVREHGYAFQIYDPTTKLWVEISGTETLVPQDFGADVTMELEVDGRKVTIDDVDERALLEEGKTPEPHIWVLPDGGIEPPFTLRFLGEPDQPSFELSLTELGETDKQKIDALF